MTHQSWSKQQKKPPLSVCCHNSNSYANSQQHSKGAQRQNQVIFIIFWGSFFSAKLFSNVVFNRPKTLGGLTIDLFMNFECEQVEYLSNISSVTISQPPFFSFLLFFLFLHSFWTCIWFMFLMKWCLGLLIMIMFGCKIHFL